VPYLGSEDFLKKLEPISSTSTSFLANFEAESAEFLYSELSFSFFLFVIDL
jgi:hypothetical protein